jgi:hypothetical protein
VEAIQIVIFGVPVAAAHENCDDNNTIPAKANNIAMLFP